MASVSGKRGSTDQRITDYNAKVGWNHPRYKLLSTVISLVLSSLGGQNLVLHVTSFGGGGEGGTSHRLSVGQKLGRGTGMA